MTEISLNYGSARRRTSKTIPKAKNANGRAIESSTPSDNFVQKLPSTMRDLKSQRETMVTHGTSAAWGRWQEKGLTKNQSRRWEKAENQQAEGVYSAL